MDMTCPIYTNLRILSRVNNRPIRLMTWQNRLRQGLKVPVSRVAGLKTPPKPAQKDGLSGTFSPAKGKAGVFNP